MNILDLRARGYIERSRSDLLHDLHVALESLSAVAAEWSANGVRDSDVEGVGRTCEGIRRLLIDMQGGAPNAA